jgi:hypothetical protein
VVFVLGRALILQLVILHLGAHTSRGSCRQPPWWSLGSRPDWLASSRSNPR